MTMIIWTIVYWAIIGGLWVWEDQLFSSPWTSKRERRIRFLVYFAVMTVFYIPFTIIIDAVLANKLDCIAVARTLVCKKVGE